MGGSNVQLMKAQKQQFKSVNNAQTRLQDMFEALVQDFEAVQGELKTTQASLKAWNAESHNQGVMITSLEDELVDTKAALTAEKKALEAMKKKS